MARLTKELRDRCVKLLRDHAESLPGIANREDKRATAWELARCIPVDYPDLANHPTTTELEDGRVQITLTAEEWRAIREAAR